MALWPAQRSSNSYAGVYSSFAQARAVMGSHVGFDSAVGAGDYRERLGHQNFPLVDVLPPMLGCALEDAQQ